MKGEARDDDERGEGRGREEKEERKGVDWRTN